MARTFTRARVARFIIDGAAATFDGFVDSVAATPRRNVTYTTIRCAMGATRSVAPKGPVAGQTIIPVASLQNRRGTAKTAVAIHDHRQQLNDRAKAYKDAYTILTNTKKVVGF